MLYKFLSSIKSSVYILLVLSVIYLIGTIFPQGKNIEDYIEAGGKYVTVVRAFDFLDIFMSPLFLIVTGVLILNLSLCIYDRLTIFLRHKKKPIGFRLLKNHSHVVTFSGINIEERLRKLGFRLIDESRGAADPGVKVFHKGLPYWWLSWFYHVGIILAIIGFFLTALFAFEKDVVLYPGEPQEISLFSDETRWNAFFNKIGTKADNNDKEQTYTLTLREFNTEYYQGLKIEYPKDKYERLKTGIGLRKLTSSNKDFTYMPKMWQTVMDVKRPDGRIINAELKVNRPFRTSSLTLYQMGYEQKATVAIDDKVMEVEARVPFEAEGIEGSLVLGSLKLGKLFKRDGTAEKIEPFTTLYFIPAKESSKREILGVLRFGERLEAKGVQIEFRDFKEGSYLSYRKDPGVWLVGVASLFVFLGLIIRCLGAWYRVQCSSEKKTSYVLISSRGILADKDRIIRKLQ